MESFIALYTELTKRHCF